MELKPGYKLTEVGVIPEDWGIVPLGDIFSFKNGLNKAKEYFGFGTPIVNYMDVYQTSGLQSGDLRGRVTLTPAEIRAYNVRKGDVFFTRTSETVEEIGIASVMLDDPLDTVFSGFILRARPRNEYLDEQYEKYCFSANHFRCAVTSTSSYTTRALTNGRLLSEIFIPLPPLSEQRAIAEALSDVDALLGKLDQVIAKKRDIKQGAMQELLTGKRRLPGFSGKWEVKKLGEIARVTMGQSPSSKNYNSKGTGVPLIQGNADIQDRRTIARIFTTEITRRGSTGDVIMSVRAPVGEIAILTFDACLGRGVCAISYPSSFLYHCLVFHEPVWARLSKGSTFDSVTSTDVKDFELSMPIRAEEQTAIASVLSDMDAEIAGLEAKREKVRQLKQGMMQELLTGRIRLV